MQGWAEMRQAQEQAVAPVLAGDTDLLIASPTASGKTEAAFLPALSAIIEDELSGVRILYLSPLKALINDQYRRLEGLAEQLDIPVTAWHGDANQGRKKELLKYPKGVLLITPESLEALFVNHGERLRALFGNLAYIIIDELHAFIGSERGRQLQSLMHRLELIVRRRIPRLGLSATLGDLGLATGFLRPGALFPCMIVNIPGEQDRVHSRNLTGPKSRYHAAF
ncbi:MAG: DEAD/DEAH box helicase, partial [Pseudomonadota bacterium]